MPDDARASQTKPARIVMDARKEHVRQPIEWPSMAQYANINPNAASPADGFLSDRETSA
jgi:hypothetical protein